MITICSVMGCHSKVGVFKCPDDVPLRERWITAMKGNFSTGKRSNLVKLMYTSLVSFQVIGLFLINYHGGI